MWVDVDRGIGNNLLAFMNFELGFDYFFVVLMHVLEIKIVFEDMEFSVWVVI